MQYCQKSILLTNSQMHQNYLSVNNMEKKNFTSTPFRALVKLTFLRSPSTSIMETNMKKKNVKTGGQKKTGLCKKSKTGVWKIKLKCDKKSKL